MKTRALQERWYRAPIASGLAEGSRVDHEAGTITGMVVMEEGPARGHGEEVDLQTLESLVALENGSKLGPKSRFGHPGMSDDALGSFAGRQSNFRMDVKGGVNRVIGDMAFDASALADPSKMADRTMIRAESDPESFGNSVVIKRELEFRFEDDGETRVKDAEGFDLPGLIRPVELMASDLVDSPAATTALFSEDDFLGTNVQLSAGVTEALDDLVERPGFEDMAVQFFSKFALSRPDAAARIRAAIERSDHQQPTEVEMKDDDKSSEDESLFQRFQAWRKGGSPSDDSAPEASLGALLAPALQATEVAATEVAALREEVASMKASADADRIKAEATRILGLTHAFNARVDAQVALANLTANGAENFKQRGEQLILAGGDAEEMLAPFETGVNVYDEVDLRQEVTWAVPVPGHDDLPVDALSFGSVQADDGSLKPSISREEANQITVAMKGKKGAEAVEELRKDFNMAEGKY